jgi:2-hydroxyacyl-CoA lyase 1
MGKGVVDDDNEYCVAAARSTALKDADLVILLGARLNWMLHFGKSPRFSKDVKIVQVDIHAEELGNNTNNCIKVQADLKTFTSQMNEHFKSNSFKLDIPQWWSTLKQKVEKNKAIIQVSPLNIDSFI